MHIQDTISAKEAWDKLREVYEDSGLSKKVGLLRALVTRLEICASVEEYVTKIISISHKLNGMSFEVKVDEWIGTLLLAGLPDKYKPMIMGIENSNIPITSIKTKLLQEDDVCHKSSAGDTALQAKPRYETRSYDQYFYQRT